jgi:hypothetical protein
MHVPVLRGVCCAVPGCSLHTPRVAVHPPPRGPPVRSRLRPGLPLHLRRARHGGWRRWRWHAGCLVRPVSDGREHVLNRCCGYMSNELLVEPFDGSTVTLLILARAYSQEGSDLRLRVRAPNIATGNIRTGIKKKKAKPKAKPTGLLARSLPACTDGHRASSACTRGPIPAMCPGATGPSPLSEPQ